MPLPQEKHLYEYAVLRFMPDAERGEFINIGLVMMCKRRRWLRVAFCIDMDRIKCLFPGTDTELLRHRLTGIEQVAAGKGVSPVASLECHERFRWLCAVRSASIRTSATHPGECQNLEDTFNRLFSILVAPPDSDSAGGAQN